MLKDESLLRPELTIWKSFAGTEFPLGLTKGFRCMPVFGRRLLRQSSKLSTEIRVHEKKKNTEKGELGVGAMPIGEPSTFPCG